jgi:mannose-6-phosphate isomerase-like protein (cupin superfamily)
MSDSPESRLNYVGSWPVPGPEARRRKKILVIKPTETLDLIHGKNAHVLVSFAISNDLIHFGSMTIPAGVLSDPERHAGDEVLYALEGNVSIVIGAEGQNPSVSKSRFEVKQGERFLIPENTEHRYLNTSARSVKIIFGIAPGV